MKFDLNLSPRMRLIAKLVGYPLFTIVVFFLALLYTFPYERVRDVASDALAKWFVVTPGSVHRSLIPGRVIFRDVMLKSIQSDPTKPATETYISELVVDVGLLSMITGDLDVHVLASLSGGTLDANVEVDGANLVVAAKTVNLPLGNVPGLASAVGLPMTGGMNTNIDLVLPNRKWRNANGSIKLSCMECTVGDGKSKFQIKPQEGMKSARTQAFQKQFVGDGVTVPFLKLGAFQGEIEIAKGVGTIKTLSANSADGFLKLEGKIEFHDPLGESLFPACLTFKFSEELRKREEQFVMGIEFGMTRPEFQMADGSFALPLKGKLSNFRPDPKRKCNAGGGGPDVDLVDGRQGVPRISGEEIPRPSLGTAPEGFPARPDPQFPPGSIPSNNIPPPMEMPQPPPGFPAEPMPSAEGTMGNRPGVNPSSANGPQEMPPPMPGEQPSEVATPRGNPLQEGPGREPMQDPNQDPTGRPVDDVGAPAQPTENPTANPPNMDDRPPSTE